jgi:GNAT superfamily N-acetyltransferase
MTVLQKRFVQHAEIEPALQSEIEALDRLAFADDDINNDPEFASIQWSEPDWMGLGFLNGKLVTQVCLPKREISVGGENVWVAGIGGMATHPDFQRKGYGLALLKAAEPFMRDELRVSFGLLICDGSVRPFYELARWHFAADALYYEQDNQRRILNTCVMILPLMDLNWLSGEIDLCGLPW